jgi:general secretion pathway protein I
MGSIQSQCRKADMRGTARRARGFTLLEVLVALAILALSAAAVLRQTQLGIKQQQQLELKSYALAIADDALATMLAQNDWPPLGRNEQTQEFQSQQWLIVTDVQAAPDPDLRKIEMSVGLVREGEREPTPLLRLTTYRGEY